MATDLKYRDIVRDIAFGNFGYVTTKEAAEAGVPAVELPKLAARGGLENIAYGIYRVPEAPASAFDQFAEALLRAGEGSFIYGESVLAIFGLADVNPRRIKVGVQRRTRPKLPTYIELVPVKGEVETTYYEGLRCQRVAGAILACRGRIEPTRLREAAREARKQGLVTRVEWPRIRKELQA
jgi:predicted transcriptional regulator of viral defense system